MDAIIQSSQESQVFLELAVEVKDVRHRYAHSAVARIFLGLPGLQSLPVWRLREKTVVPPYVFAGPSPRSLRCLTAILLERSEKTTRWRTSSIHHEKRGAFSQHNVKLRPSRMWGAVRGAVGLAPSKITLVTRSVSI